MILSGTAREVATMSNGGQRAFDAEIAAVREEVGERWGQWPERLTSPEEMRAIELEIAALARQVADALTESLLRTKLPDTEFVAPALAAALSSSKPMRRSGSAKVPVTLLGGRRIELKVPYLSPLGPDGGAQLMQDKSAA
jgi:hypothetical protein